MAVKLKFANIQIADVADAPPSPAPVPDID
jgi:hypothetical protein